MTKVGVILSRGGSPFGAAIQILRDCGYEIEPVVVTDRDCGAEDLCRQLNIPVHRIEEVDKIKFSKECGEFLFKENKVEWAILFFTRLVTSDLYQRGLCINIHPSLLPAFPGLSAIKKAYESKVRLIGVTAHVVDHTIDKGQILCQVVASVSPAGQSIHDYERISFAQKIYIFLIVCELSIKGMLFEHALENQHGKILIISCTKLQKAFNEFLEKEGITWSQQ